MHARSSQRGPEEPATSLVFPTYNPGGTLERTWRELMRFLKHEGNGWEVLFVCDGCTDGTPERLEEWIRGQPHYIRVLSYAANRGKGHAVRQGMSAARGTARLFTDVDLAYGFEDILRVAKTLHDGADVVVASRTHPQSTLVLPADLQGYVYRRHLQSVVYSALVRLVLRLPVLDTQAGLKGLSARAAQLVMPRLRCDGFAFDCEMLTACARLGLAVTEVPVCVRHHDRTSTIGLRAVANMLADIWRTWRAWRHPPGPLPTVESVGDARQAA